MINPLIKSNSAQSEDINTFAVPANFYFGTIVATAAGLRCVVKLDGSNTEMTVKYARGITIGINYRSIIMELNGTYMVMASIPS